MMEKERTRMNEASYRAWWSLHLRKARGESLDAEEQAAYESGLTQLHRSETLAADSASLCQERETIQRLEAEYTRLHEERNRLDAEIAALERVLEAGTPERLAMKD
jgi:hypothetical protein